MNKHGVLEVIGVGGDGDEAEVTIELRNQFPGLGATIITKEGVIAALRKEKHPSPKSAHRLFLKHTIVKKFDDYFYRKGIFLYSHIPRPFGSISSDHKSFEAYLYEWTFGEDGFCWKSVDNENQTCDTQLTDWNEFMGNFNVAGLEVGRDICDPDDGRVSKNIIHKFPRYKKDGIILNSLWKRIDFGYSSFRIDFEKLSKYLRDRRNDLIRVLKSQRYEMLLLSVEYLTQREKMTEKNKGKLEILLADYREVSLSHYARGIGDTTARPQFALTTESL